MNKLPSFFALSLIVTFVLAMATAPQAIALPTDDPTPSLVHPEKTARRLAIQGDDYARHGELSQALEHYSLSIRVSKLRDPDYLDLVLQRKIVALLEQLNEQKTHQTIVELIEQGDAYAATAPARALACYSLSIRVGLQHNAQYTDAKTQDKIMKLIKLGSGSR